MMLKLKPGVDASTIQPELLLGLMVVAEVYRLNGHDCVITSLKDGVHSPRSFHSRDNICRAVDIRTKFVPDELMANMIAEIKASLTPDYDVILEGSGTPNEHLHLEFDFKPRTAPEKV